jgi:hypothetical protein
MRFPAQKNFRSWLEGKDSDTVVGEACSHGRCPLARYLEEHGALAPYVRPDRVARNSCWRSTDSGADRHILPKWANEFAKALDRSTHGGVSRDFCLQVLDSVNTL